MVLRVKKITGPLPTKKNAMFVEAITAEGDVVKLKSFGDDTNKLFKELDPNVNQVTVL